MIYWSIFLQHIDVDRFSQTQDAGFLAGFPVDSRENLAFSHILRPSG